MVRVQANKLPYSSRQKGKEAAERNFVSNTNARHHFAVRIMVGRDKSIRVTGYISHKRNITAFYRIL